MGIRVPCLRVSLAPMTALPRQKPSAVLGPMFTFAPPQDCGDPPNTTPSARRDGALGLALWAGRRGMMRWSVLIGSGLFAPEWRELPSIPSLCCRSTEAGSKLNGLILGARAPRSTWFARRKLRAADMWVNSAYGPTFHAGRVLVGLSIGLVSKTVASCVRSHCAGVWEALTLMWLR
jgi:hypothetical protein